MEDNKKFELNDEALDQVAGGSRYLQPSDVQLLPGDTVGLIYKDHCPQKGLFESTADHGEVYVSISGNTCPKGTVVSDLGDSMVVSMNCCGAQFTFPKSELGTLPEYNYSRKRL